MLRDLIAGQGTRNRIERPAKFGGGFGLEIPHVEMAGATPLPQQNHAQIFRCEDSAWAESRSQSARPSPPNDKAPTLRRSRREIPSQDSILFSANVKHVRVP